MISIPASMISDIVFLSTAFLIALFAGLLTWIFSFFTSSTFTASLVAFILGLIVNICIIVIFHPTFQGAWWGYGIVAWTIVVEACVFCFFGFSHYDYYEGISFFGTGLILLILAIILGLGSIPWSSNLPQQLVAKGTVKNIKSFVQDGTTRYEIQLEGNPHIWSLSSDVSNLAPFVQAGDQVSFTYYESRTRIEDDILSFDDVRLDREFPTSTALYICPFPSS